MSGIFKGSGMEMNDEVYAMMVEEFGEPTAKAIRSMSIALDGTRMEHALKAMAFLMCFVIDCADDKPGEFNAAMQFIAERVNFDKPPYTSGECTCHEEKDHTVN